MNSSTDPHQIDLEIKDAQVIFSTIWETLEEELGHANLRFPKELILLGGAPGAGKGTHTQFIMKARGLTCQPIVVSSLLDTPDMRALKNRGSMVGDREAVSIVLRKLLEEDFRDGAVLDGFPRTRVQVECLKLLVTKINELHKEYRETPMAIHFRQPTIHAMVLFISEKTSIERQIKRGEEAAIHNQEVEETGVGQLLPVRETDLNPATARRRYRVFKEQTWDALNSLKEIYHYHYVNAEGNVLEVEENILKELQYQSSLELDPRTFEVVRKLPLAEEIVRHARQELVKRLDSYVIEHEQVFVKVVNILHEKFMPIIMRHALSGRAVVNSEDPIFEDPLALTMLIDIFSERGYHAVIDKVIRDIPLRVDLETGDIEHLIKFVYRVQVHFKSSEIRRG